STSGFWMKSTFGPAKPSVCASCRCWSGCWGGEAGLAEWVGALAYVGERVRRASHPRSIREGSLAAKVAPCSCTCSCTSSTRQGGPTTKVAHRGHPVCSGGMVGGCGGRRRGETDGEWFGMEKGRMKIALAEAIGTFGLIFIGVLAVTGGLLAGADPGVVTITSVALAHGLIIFVLV